MLVVSSAPTEEVETEAEEEDEDEAWFWRAALGLRMTGPAEAMATASAGWSCHHSEMDHQLSAEKNTNAYDPRTLTKSKAAPV